MYLKRIEISGFKSFAQKTVLDFLPSCSFGKNGKKCGITAIVGPNGSGKSNVADAIKWAMGEQSLKSLRGKKSEDVIFAGSGKKSQLGSAKVSLFFDNSDGSIPIEFEEVAISRKIYRSGEGEYFINGSRVRLIDVADLLAKAGIGQRSYCIINQGMADAVLNATPIERRIILEEAAGVKPYQLKKERSIKKLEASRANLSRVADLIREIEPHLRVLKRQAEKARKSEHVKQELQEKQKIFFGSLWRENSARKKLIMSDKEEMGREEMKMQRKIDDLEIKLSRESKASIDFEGKRSFLEKEREEFFSLLNDVRKELAVSEARIEIEKENSKNKLRISEIPVDFPYFKEELKKIRSEIDMFGTKFRDAQNMSDIEALKKNFFLFKKEIDRLYEEIIKGKKEKTEEKNSDNVVDLKLIGELEKNRKILVDKKELYKIQVAQNKEKMESLLREDRIARRLYFELEAELRKIQEKMSGIRDRLNEIRVNLARIEVREDDLRKKIKIEIGTEDPDELIVFGKAFEPGEAEKMEREVGRLKVLSEQIGSIDPMIVEEYEETQKRYDFLSGQSEDLEKAIISLSEVIKEVDEKIRESFDVTFEKVNAEFSKYFKIIFGGGSAEMVKTKIGKRKSDKSELVFEDADPEEGEGALVENPSEEKKETGIEIKACPPGKRISSLAMLSGGERSLTSQALLFAIISNNPPPFAVLDEVEAALDEANSRRFGRILGELSHETQFVLITHNRETMRQASFLYGVTMGADGISKVLSVKIDQVGEGGKIA